MSQEYILLLIILALSIVGHNMSVTYAVCIVLLLKVLGLNTALETFGKQGLNWGIIILTAAILVPIANGTITYKDMTNCFTSRTGIIALLVGSWVAVAGHFGVDVLKSTPELVSSLIIGTMLGVFFFDGVAVGPLIAAGIVYWILNILKYLHI
ncbi:MAG: DUF441 domain-containing protein [Phascolarctobacterium sp.]|nr:DUF441 domain-containing protein [Phascolarctobacterium sp.]